jgi:hypothetical protein
LANFTIKASQEHRVARALEEIHSALGLGYNITVIARSERAAEPILITGECTPQIQDMLFEVAKI